MSQGWDRSLKLFGVTHGEEYAGITLGPVEIQDSQSGSNLIQAPFGDRNDDTFLSDGCPVVEDRAALLG